MIFGPHFYFTSLGSIIQTQCILKQKLRWLKGDWKGLLLTKLIIKSCMHRIWKPLILLASFLVIFTKARQGPRLRSRLGLSWMRTLSHPERYLFLGMSKCLKYVLLQRFLHSAGPIPSWPRSWYIKLAGPAGSMSTCLSRHLSLHAALHAT